MAFGFTVVQGGAERTKYKTVARSPAPGPHAPGAGGGAAGIAWGPPLTVRRLRLAAALALAAPGLVACGNSGSGGTALPSL
jgi:hypothetical protein